MRSTSKPYFHFCHTNGLHPSHNDHGPHKNEKRMKRKRELAYQRIGLTHGYDFCLPDINIYF